MAQITKAQAITLLAVVYDGERVEDETDVELVQRIRNEKRARTEARLARKFAQIDASLKAEALEQYYIDNPSDRETVADLD